MYLIVLFPNENSVEGVPKSWVTEKKGKQYCYWPRKAEKVTAYVKKNEPPGKDWLKVTCVVKCSAETYEEMRSKVKEAQDITTEYHSSSESETSKGSPLRRSSSSSDEDCNISCPPSPPQKRQHLNPTGKW